MQYIDREEDRTKIIKLFYQTLLLVAKEDMEVLISSLISKGHKITPQRLHIIKHLWRKVIIDNIDDLYVEIRAIQHISWATLYSTIKLLHDLGWLERLGNGPRGKYYRWIRKDLKYVMSH